MKEQHIAFKLSRDLQKQIDQVIKDKGYTVTEIAAKAGIPRGNMRPILNGTKGCELVTFIALQLALDLPLPKII